MSRSLLAVPVVLGLSAVAACTSGIQYPGQLVGSFDTALVGQSNSCLDFANLPGFCLDGGVGPCGDAGYPDAGATVLVVSTEPDGGYGFISYQSGAQSATSVGTFDGQTVTTVASANRLFVRNDQPPADAGCVAVVTETIELRIYADLDGGCDGGIPDGPPPIDIQGTWQTQDSPACGVLVDQVFPDPTLCCADPLQDGGCNVPIPPPCSVSFGLTGQGRASPP
ncbi:MAG TPA: hypothetical protein VEJ89_11110 [Myxococcaceae bacterium]|jgi:hypothetical protein|nr:hypothetical protein [Myxococcaceae bacterium]